jgi:hypothetical protein
MLEPLIDRQDHQLARAAQPPRIQKTGNIRERPSVLTRVPTKNFFYSRSHDFPLKLEFFGALRLFGKPTRYPGN